MTRAARSVLLFGYYLIATGIALMAAPNLVLAPVGIAPATEPWIHVLGVVVGVLGAYYVVAAKAQLDPFFRATVWGRVLILVGFIALVVLRIAPAPLILFGVVDALGALWTWMSLRSAGTA
ncbi:MAG: hypothetical protein U0132_13520 [Gemmatimonadaceae bacterium]